MNTMEYVRNLFGAALPVVAIDSPSAEELTTIEQIYTEVGRKLKLPVYCFDLAGGLRQVLPAQDVIYRLPDGTEWTEAVTEEDGKPCTDAGIELTVEQEPSSGIAFQSVATSFKHPLLNIFQYIEQFDKKGIFVLIDLHQFLDGDRVVHEAKRYLKYLAVALKQSHKRIVLLGQDIRLGHDFSGLVYEAQSRLPELPEIQEAVNLAIADMSDEFTAARRKFEVQLTPDNREALFAACRGLTIEEALNALRIDGRSRRAIDGQTPRAITQFKIGKLEKLNIKFSLPPDVVPGGVQNFKEWVVQRKRLFNAIVSKQPTKLKLKTPRGCMIVGPSGTGKSLLAKTLGASWNIPILQVDLGSFYGSLVGETERNFRSFTRLIDSLGPVVVLFDEVEKALGGSVGGAASTDSGVSQRLFGALLTWMNDKTSPVFVVATANSLEGLPPEFKRKGRFDEIWFVDTPRPEERIEILSIHLSKHESLTQFTAQQLEQLAELTEEFVGAELGYVVDEAAILAAEQGLDAIAPHHVEQVITCTVPLARSQAETLSYLRRWAETSARPASPPVVERAVQLAPQGRRKLQLLLEDE